MSLKPVSQIIREKFYLTYRFLNGRQVPIINVMASDVQEFHEKFKLDYHGVPRFLPPQLHKLSLIQLREEIDEYEQAVKEGDLAKAFDALIDLCYFGIGRAYLHGFPLAEGWQRVHEANMLKERSQRPNSGERGGGWDIVKPVGWTPPDLSDLIKLPLSEERYEDDGHPEEMPEHGQSGNRL